MKGSYMRGPCDCGAEDCIRCYPQNFRNGKYIGDGVEEEEEDGDGLAYIPENEDEDDDGSYYDYCYPNQ